ncbi:MAG: hypothetical protein C4541_13120 [Candidatus Auribacter fodinae]|jgi:hypothetical protein|uniref:Uncharacterized protein n=1 Tax=Candidatus Auribacter fodinae TaxID=2093366 RepID=A0A3A4QZU4_9BACT|nr:MAG: hypothetical protein C4541_13120 [Candidatus Auribacter fodinae]
MLSNLVITKKQTKELFSFMTTQLQTPDSHTNSSFSLEELKPILRFFAKSSLYGISLAVILAVCLAGGLMLFSR